MPDTRRGTLGPAVRTSRRLPCAVRGNFETLWRFPHRQEHDITSAWPIYYDLSRHCDNNRLLAGARAKKVRQRKVRRLPLYRMIRFSKLCCPGRTAAGFFRQARIVARTAQSGDNCIKLVAIWFNRAIAAPVLLRCEQNGGDWRHIGSIIKLAVPAFNLQSDLRIGGWQGTRNDCLMRRRRWQARHWKALCWTQA